jgi:hypothetical protein
MASAPKSARIFAFNIGFGDCFLLRFNYAANVARHILIDFGTMERPDGASKTFAVDVANEIKKLCGGHLEIVVATHRHLDHVSGFKTDGSKTDSGGIIAGLQPDLVMQPWTEDPQAPKDATAPKKKKLTAHGFRQSLADMSAVATAAQRFGLMRANSARGRELAVIGMDNIKNPEAVENLRTMGRRKPLYLKAGDEVNISTLLPGVEVKVLGPPSVDDWPEVRKQAENYRDQYWLKRSKTAERIGEKGQGQPLFRDRVEKLPAYALWVADHARAAETEAFYGIVRELDNAMNNTSLILLFEVGGKKLLFPGDAQGENWAYALSRDDWKKLLKDVDLYKVGHHGSRNATPKDLWNLFDNKGPAGKRGRLKSVMSTKHGVHGEKKETEVPHYRLLDHLEDETALTNTEGASTLYVTCDIDF